MLIIKFYAKIERKIFELKKGVRSGNDGVLHTTITPKITLHGQMYFINKFLDKNVFDF